MKFCGNACDRLMVAAHGCSVQQNYNLLVVLCVAMQQNGPKTESMEVGKIAKFDAQ